jgi:hypothetical protein
MPDYLVTWEINVTADNPARAAQEALTIQRDPESTATTFQVIPEDPGLDPITVELNDEASIQEASILSPPLPAQTRFERRSAQGDSWVS